MDQVLVLTWFLTIVGLVSSASDLTNQTNLTDFQNNLTDFVAVDTNLKNLMSNWTQVDFKLLLTPIGQRNVDSGVVGQSCNRTLWEERLKTFVSSTTNQYPLETNLDWAALIYSTINPNTSETTTDASVDKNRSSTDNTSAEKLSSDKLSSEKLILASSTMCFTGGPFTVCTQSGLCACDNVRYVQTNHSCLGKLHSNCGLGIGCHAGLECIYQNCWPSSENNCSFWEADPTNRVLGYCGGRDDIYFELRRQKWPYKQFEYLMQGVVVSAVSLFGIVGNFISVLVLTRPRLRSSMSHVLLGMTVSDIVYLLGQFLDTGIDNSISYFTVTRDKFVYMPDDDGASYGYSLMRKWSYFMYELGNVGSIYFTILVSLERYIVVCHSLQARRICTRKNALLASLAVCCFTLFFNFPKIFATEISSDFSGPNSTSSGRHRNSPLDRSLPNMTIRIPEITRNFTVEQFYIMTTPFGYSKQYNLYLQWGKIIFKYFIPYYWLIFFNFWIILELKRSDRIRQSMTNREYRQYEDGRPRKPSAPASSSSTTRMMLCVVAVFGLCYLPLFIHEIFFRIPNYEPFGNSYDLMYRSIRSSVIYSFVKLLATLNSSVNFIIYCVLGEKFRLALKLMFCPNAKGHKGQVTADSSHSRSLQKHS